MRSTLTVTGPLVAVQLVVAAVASDDTSCCSSSSASNRIIARQSALKFSRAARAGARAIATARGTHIRIYTWKFRFLKVYLLYDEFVPILKSASRPHSPHGIVPLCNYTL